MKEKSTQASVLIPTLEEVRCRFETWRSRKKAGSPIPSALWQAGIDQCQAHFILEVSRAPECIVEMEAANGAKLRMHFLGQQRGIDPVGLATVFLRQGL